MANQDQNFVLLMGWFIVTGIGFIGVIWFLLFKNKASKTSTDFDWEPVLKWQRIALSIDTLTKSGELCISFNDDIYTVTLLGKVRSFGGFLTYNLFVVSEELDLALKRLECDNLTKLLEMATKVGE